VTLEIMYDHMWHGLRLLATPYRVPYSKRLYKLRVVNTRGTFWVYTGCCEIAA